MVCLGAFKMDFGDFIFLDLSFIASFRTLFLFFIFFGGLIFLFLWPITRDSMMIVLSWFLGLMITIVLKVLLTMLLRKKLYIAFFRKRPCLGNLSALAMECWNIGLGGGVLIGRLTQFALASAFWIGRIDVPFLDSEVNLLGYRFDYAPANYRKDVLGMMTIKEYYDLFLRK